MTYRWGGVLRGQLASSATASGGGGGGGGSPFSGAYEDSDQALDNIQTVYTFSGMTFGAADAARILVVAVGYTATAVATSCTVMIGGVTASSVKTVSRTTPDGETIGLQLHQAAVPSGTSGTVQVTFDKAQRGCGVGLWKIVTSNQAAQFTGSGTTSGGSPSVAATVPTGGFGVCAAIFDATSALGTATPSNFTEDFDGLDIWTNGHVWVQGGHFSANATLGSSGDVSCEGALIIYGSWGQ